MFERVHGMDAAFLSMEDGGNMLHAGSQAAKEQDRLLGPSLICEVSGLVTPIAGSILSRFPSLTGIMHRPRPMVNVVLSTYPGPPFPLYCAGAPLAAPYPIGPIIDGAAINITVQTYLDALHLGVVTSGSAGPDPWEFVTGLSDSLAELTKVAA